MLTEFDMERFELNFKRVFEELDDCEQGGWYEHQESVQSRESNERPVRSNNQV